jgi:hypothetical protein
MSFMLPYNSQFATQIVCDSFTRGYITKIENTYTRLKKKPLEFVREFHERNKDRGILCRLFNIEIAANILAAERILEKNKP